MGRVGTACGRRVDRSGATDPRPSSPNHASAAAARRGHVFVRTFYCRTRVQLSPELRSSARRRRSGPFVLAPHSREWLPPHFAQHARGECYAATDRSTALAPHSREWPPPHFANTPGRSVTRNVYPLTQSGAAWAGLKATLQAVFRVARALADSAPNFPRSTFDTVCWQTRARAATSL